MSFNEVLDGALCRYSALFSIGRGGGRSEGRGKELTVLVKVFFDDSIKMRQKFSPNTKCIGIISPVEAADIHAFKRSMVKPEFAVINQMEQRRLQIIEMNKRKLVSIAKTIFNMLWAKQPTL